MKYSYYPGCTLKTKAKELNDYAIASAKALGIEMEEIEDWQCCGGVYSTATDEIANKLSSVRALAQARDKGQDLLTLCSACHNVIKRVNNDMRNNEDFRTRANNYMAPDMEYNGEANVIHYLEMLRDVVGFDNLKKAVVNPLKGKKIAAYYGCLLLRPGKVMEFDDPENPKIMVEISIHGQGEYIWRYIPHFVNLNANIIIDRSGRKLSPYNPSQSITVIDITYNSFIIRSICYCRAISSTYKPYFDNALIRHHSDY